MPKDTDLQTKYSSFLQGEKIKDVIPVMHQWKGCNLVRTATRLICIQDDNAGLKPLYDLQLQQIEASFCNSYSIKIKYPGAKDHKFIFMGGSATKNQRFGRALPKMQSPPELSGKQIAMVLGGGAALIGFIAIANILNPASYNYKTLNSQTFMEECEAKLKSDFRDVKIDGMPFLETSITDDDRVKIYFSTTGQGQVSTYVCLARKDWTIKTSGVIGD
jgi:hypothetical protein